MGNALVYCIISVFRIGENWYNVLTFILTNEIVITEQREQFLNIKPVLRGQLWKKEKIT